MTVISQSVVDPRNFALILFAIGGSVFSLGVLKLDFIISLAGFGIVAIGALLYFLGKSTYKVTYHQQSGDFELNNRKESLIINKSAVQGVEKRITFFQTWWPLPRHYYYVLKTKNELGKKANYRFVIWSSEPNILRNYGMLRRSVES
jgi:hypothetical protein